MAFSGMRIRWWWPLALFFLLLVFAFLVRLQKTESQKGRFGQNTIVYTSIKKEPELLNPIRSTDLYAWLLNSYVYDSLLRINLQTAELEPHLAKSWHVSADGLTFTFKLRENIKWHDGTPLTAKDVVFSFNAYKDPAFGGMSFLAYFDRFESFKAIDDTTVVVKAKKAYFKSLYILGVKGWILPEHIYKDKDNKKLSHTMMGSGPYILERYDKGKQILLKQNPSWWGRKVKSHYHRMKRLGFRFIVHPEDVFRRMRSGDIHYILPDVVEPDEYYTYDTESAPWGETIFRRKIINKEPNTYRYVGWNLKNPLFQDVRVRKALSHLMNRELINKKIMHDTKVLASAPIYPASPYSPGLVPIPFDPKLANQLLKEAGWEDTDRNGVLDKVIDGRLRELKFTIIFSQDIVSERIFTIYQQDLKKNGVSVNIEMMEWATFLKRVYDGNFEACYLGWHFGPDGLDPDPKELWHSDSAQNTVGYVNLKVDELIDLGSGVLDRFRRIKMFKKVYRMIAEDIPLTLLFYNKFRFYSVNNKIKMEKDYYPYGLGNEFWTVEEQND